MKQGGVVLLVSHPRTRGHIGQKALTLAFAIFELTHRTHHLQTHGATHAPCGIIRSRMWRNYGSHQVKFIFFNNLVFLRAQKKTRSNPLGTRLSPTQPTRGSGRTTRVSLSILLFSTADQNISQIGKSHWARRRARSTFVASSVDKTLFIDELSVLGRV